MYSNLKKIKYYGLSWESDGFGGFIGCFATRADAEKELKKQKRENSYVDYEITVDGIDNLIKEERENAAREERIKMHDELSQRYEQRYETELKKAIEKEKKRLQKEMKKMLKNWFDIDADGKL